MKNPPAPTPDSADDPGRSTTVPDEVTMTEELLSAMLDGELERDELAELEAIAVNTAQSVQDMAAGMAASRSAVASLFHTSTEVPAAPLRRQHLAAALAAADEPEVASFAAARTARTALGLRNAKVQRRFQLLGAVAAGLVVIAGIGLIAAQGGSDELADASSAGATDDALAREVTSQSDAFDNTSDDATAGDDGAMAEESDEAFAAGAVAEGEATELPADSDLNSPTTGGAAPLYSVQLVGYVAPEGLRKLTSEGGIVLAPFDAALDPEASFTTGSPTVDDRASEAGEGRPVCAIPARKKAFSTGSDPLIGFALVDVGGTLFEVYQATDESLLIFERPECLTIS